MTEDVHRSGRWARWACFSRLCFASLLLMPTLALAQEKHHVDWYCCYLGEHLDSNMYLWDPDASARTVVDRILKYGGLVYKGLWPNIDLYAGSVHNAVATQVKKRKAIIYSQQFLDKVTDTTHSDWASLSVLAHEVGHHLFGHDLSEDIGAAQRRDYEISADEYSGFILQRMGATATEAQIAVQNFAAEDETSDYPSKKDRLAAIYYGWKEAKEQHSVPTPTPLAAATSTPSTTASPTPISCELPPDHIAGAVWQLMVDLAQLDHPPTSDEIERQFPEETRAPNRKRTGHASTWLQNNWEKYRMIAVLPAIRSWQQIGEARKTGSGTTFKFQAEFMERDSFGRRLSAFPQAVMSLDLDANGYLNYLGLTVEGNVKYAPW